MRCIPVRETTGRVVEYLAGTTPDADNITGMGILNYWSTAYSYIRKINTFLEKAEAGSVPEEVKRPMIGEMKFIRAYIVCRADLALRRRAHHREGLWPERRFRR